MRSEVCKGSDFVRTLLPFPPSSASESFINHLTGLFFVLAWGICPIFGIGKDANFFKFMAGQNREKFLKIKLVAGIGRKVALSNP
jgi:hypothetical protein